MTKNLTFLRNKILRNHVRLYEKNNNINYDVIICLRPDLHIDCNYQGTDYNDNGFKKLNINEIIYSIIKNKQKCYSRVSNHALSRYDIFFLSKYFISELINDDIINKKLKDPIFYNKIKKFQYDGKEIISMESFTYLYLQPIQFISKKIKKYLDHIIENTIIIQP